MPSLPSFVVERRGSGLVYLGILYFTGILFWLRSFWFAHLTALDWALTLNYQNLLKQAIVERRIPYVSTFHHYTNRFLGTPETPLSPQYLLLPYFDTWTFNLLNVCLLYTLSFLGLLWIRRRHGLGWLPFTLLFLLFSFNGSIVGRVGFGHTMWYGYFFLPFVYLFLFDVLEGHLVDRAVLGMAAALFLIALQGSFHVMVWTVMLLGLTAVFSGRRGLPIFRAMIWTALLCAFRIVPSALTLHGIPLQFHDAYPTLGTFFDGLTSMRHPDWMNKELGCGWVDMDCFVGFAGLALILWFGWVAPLRDESLRGRGHGPLYVAILCMILLSIGAVYESIFESGLPVLSSQRIPSRFNMVIVSSAIVVGALGLQRFLGREEPGKALQGLLAAALLIVVWDLYRHQTPWTLRNIELWVWKDNFRPEEHFRLLELDWQDPDLRRYVYTLWASAVVTLAAALAWTWKMMKTKS